MWQWIGKNHEQIKIVFAVIAALYVVFEYRVKIHEDTVAQSLTYIREFNQGRVYEARIRDNEFWLSEEMAEWRQQLRSVSDSEARVARYNKELPALIRSEKLLPDLFVLLGYYGSVALCVESKQCNPEVICRNLFDQIQGYREDYKTLLKDWKAELGSNIPDRIAYLTEHSCSEQFHQYCTELPTSSYCKHK